MLEHATAEWRPLLMFLVMTGTRVGEALATKWETSTGASGRVFNRRSLARPTRTRAGERSIELPQMLIAELKRWKLRAPMTGDLAFPTETGPAHSAST